MVERKQRSTYGLEFKPLPKRGGGSKAGVWVKRLAPLMDHKDEYAVVARGPYSSMSQTSQKLKNRTYDMPEGEWDFAVRTDVEGTEEHGEAWAELYAVYLGGDDDDADS